MAMPDEPLMAFTSHIDGANARVAIYQDRIYWTRRSLKTPGGATGALLTGGLTLLATHSRRDSNIIPVRQIQGVTTHRAGLSYTTVKVATAGDVTEFRVTKAQAEQVKQLLLQLMSGTASPYTPAPQAYPPVPAPSPPAPSSVADELRKLAELRDAGVLSPEEFESQKARLLR